ncbi:MAG: hypothetical protein H7Y27_13485 [Gemmatimonadaceae bacterium]|nr:hypothetical protein [Chitinophagaceae bacterium]
MFRISVFLIILMAVIFSITGLAQIESPPTTTPVLDVGDSVSARYETLAKAFGKNKEIPSQYKKQIIYALSYFPELTNTSIRFEVRKSKDGIISTRPTVGSIFRRSSKRTYLVIIDDSTAGRTLPSFSDADVNGQVGILGHELCHIVYFNNCTGMGLIGLGVAHVSKGFMDRFEYNTDSVDIERGLGYQLRSWKQFIDKGFMAMRAVQKPSDQDKLDKRYMSVAQIEAVMAKSELYKSLRPLKSN